MSHNQSNLVWKPKVALWVSLGFLLVSVLIWAMLLFGSAKDRTISNAIISSLYFFPALWGTIYGLRTRVEASENGVRWQDWRGVWRAAQWDEIRDFHTVSQKGLIHRVETAAGNLSFALDGDGKAIAELIAARAVNAKTREWDIQGERLCDEWPRVFSFYPSGLASLTRSALLVLLIAVGLTVYVLWFRMPPSGDLPISLYVLAYIAPPLLIPIVPFLFWLFFLVQERQARPFRGQSVEISPTGLVFNGATRVEASWSQIQTWSWKRGKIRFLELQTAQRNIEIPDSGFGLGAFYRIAERFSGVPLLKMHMEATAVYPIPDSTNETVVFDFNNREFALWNQLCLPVSGATLLMPFLMRWADPLTPQSEEASVLILGVVLIALSIGWLWFLRVARLRLTAENLEWRAPFFHRAVAWRDIESFGVTASNLDWVSVSEKKMKLSLLGIPIAQRSRLHAEIEKRAFNAKGQWETGKTPSST